MNPEEISNALITMCEFSPANADRIVAKLRDSCFAMQTAKRDAYQTLTKLADECKYDQGNELFAKMKSIDNLHALIASMCDELTNNDNLKQYQIKQKQYMDNQSKIKQNPPSIIVRQPSEAHEAHKDEPDDDEDEEDDFDDKEEAERSALLEHIKSTSSSKYPKKKCAFGECNEQIELNRSFCYEHYKIANRDK